MCTLANCATGLFLFVCLQAELSHVFRPQPAEQTRPRVQSVNIADIPFCLKQSYNNPNDRCTFYNFKVKLFKISCAMPKKLNAKGEKEKKKCYILKKKKKKHVIWHGNCTTKTYFINNRCKPKNQQYSLLSVCKVGVSSNRSKPKNQQYSFETQESVQHFSTPCFMHAICIQGWCLQ